MEWNGTGADCLDDAVVEALAVRISEGEMHFRVPVDAPPDSYPASLFLRGEEEACRHLEECGVCRMRLWMEISFVRDYRALMNRSDLVKKFREKYRSLVEHRGGAADARPHGSNGGEPGGKEEEPAGEILYFVHRDELDLGEFRLAAATGPEGPVPTTWASRDGNLLLVESFDREGAARYRLIGGAPDALKFNAQLKIGQDVFRSDEKGFVDFGEIRLTLSPDTIVMVRPCTRPPK